MSKTIRSALRKTRFLVVIATPEALASKWVVDEILLFSESGRLCIPIIFENSFTNEPVTEAMQKARNLIEDLDQLHLPESFDNLESPCPDEVHVLGKLATTKGLVRRRSVRNRIVAAVICVLCVAIVLTRMDGEWWAEMARSKAERAQQTETRARQAAESRRLAFCQTVRSKEGA